MQYLYGVYFYLVLELRWALTDHVTEAAECSMHEAIFHPPATNGIYFQRSEVSSAAGPGMNGWVMGDCTREAQVRRAWLIFHAFRAHLCQLAGACMERPQNTVDFLR